MLAPDLLIHITAATSIWLTFDRFYKDPFSIFNFSALCYSIILLGGISVVLLSDSAFGYKMPISGLRWVFVDAALGLLAMQLIHSALTLLFPHRSESSRALSSANYFALATLAALSIGSLLLFAAANGISLGQTDYEHRYEAARGWGPLIIFFPAFLPFFFYRVSQSQGLAGFLWWSTAITLVGLGTYFVMSGYRQVLIGAVILCCCVAIERKYIKKWHFLPGIGLFFSLLIALSFLRYAGDSAGSSAFDNPWIAAFYYIQGDVFPVDAPLKIREFYAAHTDPPGLDVVLNHLFKLVPRAFWPDKPLILLDAAGFYTQHVVGYARGVTLSPTVLGEGYLVGGTAGFYFAVLCGSALAWLMDRMRLMSSAGFYLFGSFIYGGFFFIREGFSELLLRALFAVAFFGIFLASRAMLEDFVRPRNRCVR